MSSLGAQGLLGHRAGGIGILALSLNEVMHVKYLEQCLAYVLLKRQALILG